FIDPKKTGHPKKPAAVFWLKYVMDETSKDASEMQVDMLRSGLINGLDFRRYQLSLDKTAVQQLPDMKLDHLKDVDADWLHELSDDFLGNIDMADVSKFPLMKTLGEAVSEYICPSEEADKPMHTRNGNWFQKDLLAPNSRRGALVTAHGNQGAIKSHLSNPQWIDNQPSR
ncbi:MAG TPA: hypothetical protein VFJ43_14340, partial [Bacteroidia bacterium]|nr:hypothetical protein [Bacteroidia bacterium]